MSPTTFLTYMAMFQSFLSIHILFKHNCDQESIVTPAPYFPSFFSQDSHLDVYFKILRLKVWSANYSVGVTQICSLQESHR